MNEASQYTPSTVKWNAVSASEGGWHFSEIPTGDINGVNTIYLLEQAPYPTTSLMLFMNGVLQREGASNDYTLSGATITMNQAPRTSSILTAVYQALA